MTPPPSLPAHPSPHPIQSSIDSHCMWNLDISRPMQNKSTSCTHLLTMQYYAQISMRQLLHAQPAYQFNRLQWRIYSRVSVKDQRGRWPLITNKTSDNRQITEFMKPTVKRFTNKTLNIYPWPTYAVEMIL